MANNCYNWVEFIGSKNTLKKLKNKFKDYEKFDYFTDWGNHVLEIKDDKSEKTFDWCYKYGTKWWEMYLETDNDNSFIITGDTAWSPPEKLCEEICKHYSVKCKMEFEEPGNDFGGYTTFNKDGKQDDYTVSYRQWRYEEDPISAMDNIMYDIEDGGYTIEDFEDDFKYMRIKDVKYIKEFVKDLSKKENKTK